MKLCLQTWTYLDLCVSNVSYASMLVPSEKLENRGTCFVWITSANGICVVVFLICFRCSRSNVPTESRHRLNIQHIFTNDSNWLKKSPVCHQHRQEYVLLYTAEKEKSLLERPSKHVNGTWDSDHKSKKKRKNNNSWTFRMSSCICFSVYVNANIG